MSCSEATLPLLTAWINSAEQIADNLNSDNMNGNIMEVINYISMAIVVAGEIILANIQLSLFLRGVVFALWE